MPPITREKVVVPFIDIVHDRAMSEIFRELYPGVAVLPGRVYLPAGSGNLWIPSTVKAAHSVKARICRNFSPFLAVHQRLYRAECRLLPRLLDWAEPEHTNISAVAACGRFFRGTGSPLST